MTLSLHMQDWVVEHWDKMPRYGEGSLLAAALLCWILSMVELSICSTATCLQSSFSMGTAQGAGMAAVRCVLPVVCKV